MLGIPGLSSGQPISFFTVPNVYTNAEGPGSSNSLIRNQANPRTIQIIINENQLTGLLNHAISGITYRLSNNLPNGYPISQTTWSDYTIQLGGSVAPVDAIDLFASNFSTSPTTVRTGPLSVSPFSWPVGTPPSPSPWGVQIQFSSTYLYTGGHLAMLITHPGSDNLDQGNSLLDATSSASPGVGVDYTTFTGNSYMATQGVETVFHNVIRFTGIAAVPEPGTVALIFLLLAVLTLKCNFHRPVVQPSADIASS